MNQPQIGSFEHIPLAAIRPSTTNPRKHFDPAALEELSNSVRELGVTVPIHVRRRSEIRYVTEKGLGQVWYGCAINIVGHRNKLETFSSATEEENKLDAEEWVANKNSGDGSYELVTGERRFRAATAAGLAEIPAIVHDGLEDEDAMDLQMVENLQRADLHPVEEADGYRALIAHGESAEDVAKMAGKTLGYVQQRLKLLTLEVDAKQLFLDKHLTLDHALLLARLTPKDQERALRYLLSLTGDYERTPLGDAIKQRLRDHNSYTPSSRVTDRTHLQLKDWIGSNVLLQLKGVPWDLGDGELVPIAGPCTTCPKRTGANQALFADLTTVEDTCVDRACFADKQKAFTARAQTLAKENGSPLLKISSKSSTDKLEKPAVEMRASAVKMQQGKAVETQRAVVVATRPVKQGQWIAAKKGSCPSTVQAIAVDGPDQGKLKWVCPDQSCKVHPRQVTKPHTEERVDRNMNSPENRATREAEQKIDEAVEAAILSALDAVDAKQARMLEFLLVEEFDRLWNANDKQRVCERLSIEVPKARATYDPKRSEAMTKRFDEWLRTATLPELHDAAMWLLIEQFKADADDDRIYGLAKRAGVNPEAIEKTVRAKFEADEKAAAGTKVAQPKKAVPAKKAAKKKGGK